MVRSQSKDSVIDLHGFSVDTALETLVTHCNKAYQSGYRGWVTVVHGYGSTGAGGVIKQRVRSLFSHHRDAFEVCFNDSANPGSTDVRILKPLRESHRTSTPLEEQILEFCKTPKEESKIGNKFHRLPFAELREVLKGLQEQGRLAMVKTNGRKALLANSS